MKQRGRRSRAWKAGIGLALGVLAIAGIWRAWPRERLLTEVAHPFWPASFDRSSFGWISDNQLLIVTTTQEPEEVESRNGVRVGKKWDGSAILLNIDTGARTAMPGLTNLFKQTTAQPCFFEISPDGKWLLWCADDNSGSDQSRHTAHLDGTHERKWKGYRHEEHFFWDARHLVQIPYEKSGIIVRDLRDSGQDREYSTPAQAEAALARSPSLLPNYRDVSDANGNGRGGHFEIGTYRPEDQLQALLYGGYSEQGSPMPLQTRALKLPAGVEFEFGEVSPQQQSILYYLRVTRVNPLRAWIHALIPKFDAQPTVSDSLWVSRIDGEGLHEIGGVPFTLDEDGLPLSHLEHIEWLPDGKHIIFSFGEWYRVSIDGQD